MNPITNETVQNLFADLGISSDFLSPGLEAMANAESRSLKDLKLNVSAVLGSSNFSKKEAYLLALSVVGNEKHDTLKAAFERHAANEGASPAEISETYACVSVMVTNNVFYRFRHFMEDVPFYNNQPAGLRMSVMMNPVLGKEFFELMSLVISAVNGCERCVAAHEKSVKEQGASESRIYDAIRLGAVIRSLCVVL